MARLVCKGLNTHKKIENGLWKLDQYHNIRYARSSHSLLVLKVTQFLCIPFIMSFLEGYLWVVLLLFC